MTRADGAADIAARVQEMLIRQIQRGELPAGAKLPTERELSERFTTSRSTIRRALSALRDQGLIEQRVGAGTFVSGGDNGLPVTEVSPAELMEARLILEPPIANLVVHNATEADFQRMLHCLDQGERAETLEEFEYWDGALHLAIAEATHNNFILNMFRLINRVRDQGEWGKLKKRSVTPERRAAYQQQHAALVAALRERDADSAREQLLAHLRNVRQNLLGY